MLQEDEARRAQLRAGAEALVGLGACAPRHVAGAAGGRGAPTELQLARRHRRARDGAPRPLSAPLFTPRPRRHDRPDSRWRIPVKPAESADDGSSFRRMRFALWLRRFYDGRRAASLRRASVAMAAGAVWLARPYVTELFTVPKTGTVVLESLPPGSEVLVDGASLGTSPLTTELPPGSHVVEFRQKNATRKIQIDVTGGQQTVSRLDWSVAPTGRLTVRSDPEGARVLVDGRERGVTPLTLDDLTLGSHAVVLQTDQGSVRRTVTVTADQCGARQRIDLCRMAEAVRAFRAADRRRDARVPAGRAEPGLLPPGPHQLRFENRALGYSETRACSRLNRARRRRFHWCRLRQRSP